MNKNTFKILYNNLKFRCLGLRHLPSRLTIDTTTRCQFRCPTCYVDINRRREGDLGFKQFRNIFDQIDWKIVWINFSLAGEPLLNQDLFQMILHSSSRNIKTFLNTNGMLIDEMANEILSSGLYLMNVDLTDFAKGENAEFRVGVNKEKIISGVKKVVKLKKRKNNLPIISLELLITKETHDFINSFIKLAKDLCVNRIILKSFNLEVGNCIITEEERLKSAKKYLSPLIRYNRYYIKGNNVFLRKEIRKSLCPDLFENITIFNDNSIGLCCMDVNKRYSFSLDEYKSVKNLILSDTFFNLRKKAVTRGLDICRNCSMPGSSMFNKVINL